METATAMATEVLTMAEIENRFDSEWVLIAEPETDEQLNVLSGKVLYHDRDRIKFDRETLDLDLGPGDFAVVYTGDLPEGMEYVL